MLYFVNFLLLKFLPLHVNFTCNKLRELFFPKNTESEFLFCLDVRQSIYMYIADQAQEQATCPTLRWLVSLVGRCSGFITCLATCRAVLLVVEQRLDKVNAEISYLKLYGEKFQRSTELFFFLN